jgi:hypothetical protein
MSAAAGEIEFRNREQQPDHLPLIGRSEAVRQCLHEAHQRIFFRSESPSLPMRFVFMLSVNSGAGQHVVPSPWSLGWQRGRTSRVL